MWSKQNISICRPDFDQVMLLCTFGASEISLTPQSLQNKYTALTHCQQTTVNCYFLITKNFITKMAYDTVVSNSGGISLYMQSIKIAFHPKR